MVKRLLLRSRLLHTRATDRTRDHQMLDLARAIEDRVHRRVAVPA